MQIYIIIQKDNVSKLELREYQRNERNCKAKVSNDLNGIREFSYSIIMNSTYQNTKNVKQDIKFPVFVFQ